MPSVGFHDERLVYLSNGYADTFQFFVESCEVIHLKKVKPKTCSCAHGSQYNNEKTKATEFTWISGK